MEEEDEKLIDVTLLLLKSQIHIMKGSYEKKLQYNQTLFLPWKGEKSDLLLLQKVS